MLLRQAIPTCKFHTTKENGPNSKDRPVQFSNFDGPIYSTTTSAVARGTTGTGDDADACSLPRLWCWWPP